MEARVPAGAEAEVEKKYGEPQEKIEVVEEGGTPKPENHIDNNAKGKAITE